MNAPQLSPETLSDLQELIEINIDSSRGFGDAAERIDDPVVKALFQDVGRERARFAQELQGFVRENHLRPESSGSWQGAVHRWWLKLRDNLGWQDAALLSEVERGEDAIVARYGKVLGENAPAAISTTLRHQHGRILQNHDRVRQLRDMAKARD